MGSQWRSRLVDSIAVVENTSARSATFKDLAASGAQGMLWAFIIGVLDEALQNQDQRMILKLYQGRGGQLVAAAEVDCGVFVVIQ